MHVECMTVQEVIDALNKVENKNVPCCVWINSQEPEVHYSGGSRIPIVHVDDMNGNMIDICCQFKAQEEDE